jgi:1,2-diacylglycerol 3-alpha-glucosyltransferase
MKIVMVCELFDERLEYQENHLADFYVRAGHEVTVITSTFKSVADYYAHRHDPRAPGREYTHAGVNIIKLPYRYNFLNRIRAFTPVDGILEAERPDMIFLHSVLPEIVQIVAYKRRHPECRLILDYHGDYSNSGAGWLSINVLHKVIRKRFLDLARPHLDMIFPITPGGRNFLAEVYGVPQEEMEILPLGVDLAYGAKVRARHEGQKVRAELGIEQDEFVVFTGGKLDFLKRTDLLIQAVRELGRPDVHVVIAGDATQDHQDYKAKLLELAAGMANVHFCGWQDKAGVYRHMDAADVAIFPASQSVLWQQAIGMGLPLVVSERPGVTPGVLQDVSYLNLYDNIVVMDYRQSLPSQIITQIVRLRDDPAARRAMAEGARRVAEEFLDWNRLIERTLSAKSPAAIARG